VVPIGAELAVELKTLMASRGFSRGSPDGSWNPEAQTRLERFLGSENYDNRINTNGMLDLEVLADLHRRYGGITLGG